MRTIALVVAVALFLPVRSVAAPDLRPRFVLADDSARAIAPADDGPEDPGERRHTGRTLFAAGTTAGVLGILLYESANRPLGVRDVSGRSAGTVAAYGLWALAGVAFGWGAWLLSTRGAARPAAVDAQTDSAEAP